VDKNTGSFVLPYNAFGERKKMFISIWSQSVYRRTLCQVETELGDRFQSQHQSFVSSKDIDGEN
jgi:hypothetical protein